MKNIQLKLAGCQIRAFFQRVVANSLPTGFKSECHKTLASAIFTLNISAL